MHCRIWSQTERQPQLLTLGPINNRWMPCLTDNIHQWLSKVLPLLIAHLRSIQNLPELIVFLLMLPSDQPSKSWGSHHNFTTLLSHLSMMHKTKQSWGSLLSVLVLILLKKFSLVVTSSQVLNLLWQNQKALPNLQPRSLQKCKRWDLSHLEVVQ